MRRSPGPNAAYGCYAQLGADDVGLRAAVDLLVALMEEPFFDELRTKKQIGYSVSCGVKWTCGVVGMEWHVVSAVMKPSEIEAAIDAFLASWPSKMASLDVEEWDEAVKGLAREKSEPFDSVADEAEFLHGEVTSGRRAWGVVRDEVAALRQLLGERGKRKLAELWEGRGGLLKVGVGDKEDVEGWGDVGRELGGGEMWEEVYVP